jgi:hypothetical protein
MKRNNGKRLGRNLGMRFTGRKLPALALITLAAMLAAAQTYAAQTILNVSYDPTR